ncbi:hypothetical protein FOMPIDRAFT_92048 [Fomitopsis schrenkii]|uniref:Uncharacterized protein n=1 Tax=Fomitopsis schrenkii TaxID=2126942 RepID=S8EDY8_FOMSC|nr:hypothetical protein FOMPIDRAFT_92048 [Fomitopsis schrenkii]
MGLPILALPKFGHGLEDPPTTKSMTPAEHSPILNCISNSYRELKSAVRGGRLTSFV